MVGSSSVASSFQPSQAVGWVADKRGASTHGTAAQVAEVPAPTTALAADEAEEGEIPPRRSPKGGKGFPSSSLGKRQTAAQPLSASSAQSSRPGPTSPKSASVSASPAATSHEGQPSQRQRGGKGAITAYLAPKPASSVTEATRSSADASGSSSSLSDARFDALIAQVRALSEQLTKQVALNAELQRQIVDLSLQLRTAKPKRTRSHSPTAPAVHDDADMSSDAEDKQKVPPQHRPSSSGRQTPSNE